MGRISQYSQFKSTPETITWDAYPAEVRFFQSQVDMSHSLSSDIDFSIPPSDVVAMGPSYWTITGPGSWDGTKYISTWAGNDRLTITAAGTWYLGYRPTKMKITMGLLPTGINAVELRDQGNFRLMYDIAPTLVAFGSQEWNLNWTEPFDIKELDMYEFNGFNTFEVTEIRFS